MFCFNCSGKKSEPTLSDKEQENNKDEQTDHTSTTDEISGRDEIVNEGVIQEPYGQLSLEISQTDTPIKSGGVPLSYLGFGDSDA